MKKLVFTIQVFGVIAMFPLYAVLEINHAREKSPSNNTSSSVSRVQEKIIPNISANTFADFENEYRGIKI